MVVDRAVCRRLAVQALLSLATVAGRAVRLRRPDQASLSPATVTD